MRDGPHERDRPPRSPLTPGELHARRRDWRRRRARRRWFAALSALSMAVLVVLLAGAGGRGDSSGSRNGRGGGGRTGPADATVHASIGGAGLTPIETHRRPATPGRRRSVPVAAPDRAVARVLRYTSYVQLAGHRRRELALTFDDGPWQYTPAILGILRRMHVKATFFVVGTAARERPRLVGLEAADGMEVADHTIAHPMLAALSPAAQATQIAGDAQQIERDRAPRPALMRPPYGSFNTDTLRVLRAQRMLMVLWSVDTRDYARPGVERIVYTAISGARPGAIILMHDGGGDRTQTIAALPRVIRRLRQRHFRLVTVSQLLADDPPPHGQPPPHSLSGGV